ncbi:MAG: UDP-N-acetylmuramoyl-L-alanine--D-glutamate ligase [Owenweeksia sp.]
MSTKDHIVVLGGGESGYGAALLAKRNGYSVFLSDGGALKDKYKHRLQEEAIDFEEGGHTDDHIFKAGLVIKSPGIPEKATIVRSLRSKNIPIISEVEWAYRFCKGKVVAITGSNGKTTTTMLTNHILKKAKLDVAMVGNIGDSFAASVAEKDHDYYVLEVSSFQLDDITSFKPHIAILTNITPDHLDRYEYKMENYAQSKFAIGRYQEKDDYFIYNTDDAETLNYLDQYKPQSHLLPISLEKQLEEGAFTNEQKHIHINLKNQEAMSINELALQGKHNAYNSMAAGLAGKLLGIRKEVIRESLAGFESIEHRLEPVLQVYGIEFINDSKATNVNSTWYAMESMQKPTIWIVGGVDKGNDYSQLHKLVKEKVKAIVCLGADNTKLHAEFEEMVPFMIDAADMDEAVRISYKLGTKNDAVLLSPACASFDLFENYEDRGRQFKAAVRRL